MKFVESLGAHVRLRPVAERTTVGSYRDLQVLKKLARLIPPPLALAPSEAENITHVRYHTYHPLIPNCVASEFILALSMNKTTQPILKQHFHLARLHQSRYFSDTKHFMRHGLSCTVR